MRNPFTIGILLLLAPVLGATARAQPADPATATAPDARLEEQFSAYERFRTLFEEGNYAGALPLAKQVVALTESDPDRDVELPIAYNNLAATQLRLGDFAAAEANYRTSLEMLEGSQGIASMRLISPLMGLGSVYAATDQHYKAVEHLARAVAISRRAEGLFNLSQLQLLDPLIDSLQAAGNGAGVDLERRYATRIAEQNFGVDDPRTIPTLTQLAVWYEQTYRYASARALYMRIHELSMKEGGSRTATTISALLGVGRTYRLQFMTDPDSLVDQSEFLLDPRTGQRTNWVIKRKPLGPKLDRDGQRALELALQTLKETADPPPRLLAGTLLELGDWFMVLGRPDTAIEHYMEAWNVLPRAIGENEPNPLAEPRLIFYRPPEAAIRSRDQPASMKRVLTSEILASVSEKGAVTEAEVVSGDMPELMSAQVRRSIRRAIYSPRFEDGNPVATSGVRFIGEWHQLLLEEARPDSGT